MLFDVVFEKAAHVAGVVQIAFAEFLGFLGAEVLAQQAGTLGQSIGLVRFDVGNEALPTFAVLGAAQVFEWRSVALVAVFAGQHQHLVVLAVVETARVGQGMVDLGRAVEEDFGDIARGGKRLLRVGTLAVLFPVKPPFLELKAFRRMAEQLNELLPVTLVPGLVFVLLFFDLVALIEWARQVTGHFDMHRRRRAVATDDGIDHLARLIQRTKNNGVARNVGILGEDHPTVLVAAVVERWQILVFAFANLVQLAVVVAGLYAGFVVAQAFFHVWHDGAQGFQRQGVELVETDIQQGFGECFLIGQGQFGEFRTDFVVVLVNAQYPCNFVEKFRLAAEGISGKLFPLIAEACLGVGQRFPQFLPGRDFD